MMTQGLIRCLAWGASQVKFRNFGRTMYTDYAYKISFPGRKRDSARSNGVRCRAVRGTVQLVYSVQRKYSPSLVDKCTE